MKIHFGVVAFVNILCISFINSEMSMDDNISEIRTGNYDLIKSDAEALLRLVNKYVKVQLIKDTEFFGFVHSIDPLQHSIILLQPDNNAYTVNIIPGHAILDVVETHSDPHYMLPEQKIATQTTDDLDIKKWKLIAWFKRNLLPITESGQKILFGNVRILPPYGVSNICTDNPVVAMQLRKIIENMPDDFDPDK